jgi:hypothetical protein
VWGDRILDALTANTPSESVDVLVTWVGAATLIRYLIVIGRRRERSPLERRASFLVGVLAALCLIRGFSWLRPDARWLGVLMLVPGTLIPLAMTLFAEGLLRRHLSAWIKRLAVALTLVALLTDLVSGLLGAEDVVASYTLVIAQLVMMVVLGLALARRDRASLSRAENGLVQSCLFVTLLGIPLAATDYRFLLGYPPARLGTLAILLFCYTLVRRPDEHVGLGRWGRDLARLLLRAALVCVVILLALRNAPRELLFPQFVLATAVVVAFSIDDRLAHVNARRNGAALLRWLARPPATTRQEFSRELHHLPLTADALLLDEADLGQYDHDALRAAFGSGRPVRSLAQLRADRAMPRGGDRRQALVARGADELTDLLERSDMTHVALIAARPLQLLLANVPALPGAEDAEIALAAVVRRAPQPTPALERVLA